MVSKREFEILKLIADGKRYFHEIQSALGLKKPIVSEYLSKLKNRGLIVEQQDPRDKRRKFYELNPDELVFVTVNDIISFIESHIELSEEERGELEKVLRSPASREYFRSRFLAIQKSGELPSIEEEVESFVDGIVAVYLFKEAFKDVYKKFAKKFAKEFVKGTPVASTTHILDIADNLPKWFAERWGNLERFKQSAIGQVVSSLVIATGNLLQKGKVVEGVLKA